MSGGDSVPRRDRILAAASREFAEHGFAGARVDRIATAAGVNKQLLFHYFRSKEGLHRATLEAVLRRPAQASQPEAYPSDRLRTLIAQLAATAESHPALLALLASPAAALGGGASAADMASAWRLSAQESVRHVLEAGQRSGHFRDDLDLEATSELIVAASLGWALSGGSAAGQRDRYSETLLKMVVDYCTWR